jgi:hypothetical protein
MPSYVPSYVRENGTFCVIVKFEVTQNAAKLGDQVTEWSKQWVAENQKWPRIEMSDDPLFPEERPTDYFEVFTGLPFVLKAENNQLWLRLDGLYSYWWRDWAARFVVDLIHVFPEMGKYKLSFTCDQ